MTRGRCRSRGARYGVSVVGPSRRVIREFRTLRLRRIPHRVSGCDPVAPEYILTANLSDIQQRNSDTKDVYYKFTMNLKNLTTGILEWSDEKEIRKVATRSTFGYEGSRYGLSLAAACPGSPYVRGAYLTL